MKENFSICIESLHVGDIGDKDNVSPFLVLKYGYVELFLMFACFCFYLLVP